MTDAPSRKKSNQRRRQRLVAVRLSEQEMSRLAEAARLADVTVAEYLRASGLRHPVGGGRKIGDVARAPAELRRLLGEVNKVGSNLNQIARAANLAAKLGQPTDTDGLAEALAELAQVRGRVRQALGLQP